MLVSLPVSPATSTVSSGTPMKPALRPAADVAKGQPVAVQFRQMGAAQIDGAGVVIALGPDPAPPRL